MESKDIIFFNSLIIFIYVKYFILILKKSILFE